MTTEQKMFIEKVATAVKKYAPQYGIKVCSPIIAQAIIESNWGKSILSSKYHNYHGMKCGSSWKGASITMSTKEENNDGTVITIKDKFRVFDNFEDGIKGYFEFINTTRYANLKGITDPQAYLKTIKSDGYATSKTYVDTNMDIITVYNLAKYDVGMNEISNPRKSISEIANEVIAGKWGNGADRKNKIIAAGYNYEEVQAEVNRLSKSNSSVPKKTASDIAKEIIKYNNWGSGSERKRRIELAGYNYSEVQAEINKLLKK